MMSNFSKEVLNRKPIPYDKVHSSPHYFVGQAAIDRVEELEGPLTPAQKRVVALEGYVDVPYLDSKGNWTIGAGQSEKYKNKTFKETFVAHELQLVKKIPKLAKLPEKVQVELMQSSYRGGITGSPKTIALINSGRLFEAADEFLNNKEYKSEDTAQGIKTRMESLASALRDSGDISGQVSKAIQEQLSTENVAPTTSQRPSRGRMEPSTGLTPDEQMELDWLKNNLGQGVPDKTGLTAEEKAELEWLRNDLGYNKVGVEYKGPAYQEAAEPPSEQDLIERIY